MRESQWRFRGEFFGPKKVQELIPSSRHILIDVWLDTNVIDAPSLEIFEQFEFIPKFHDLGAVCARASRGSGVSFLGHMRPQNS